MMDGQMSLFDTDEQFKVGEYVVKHGRRLTFDEIAGMVGRKIIMDQSTSSHEWLEIVLVEKIIWNDQENCRRLIYFDGDRQRGLVNEDCFSPEWNYSAKAYELPEIKKGRCRRWSSGNGNM